jgi:hypothetical protein
MHKWGHEDAEGQSQVVRQDGCRGHVLVVAGLGALTLGYVSTYSK